MQKLVGKTSLRIMPLYYCNFAHNAVTLGFFTVYLASIGLSSSQIGVVMALAPLASLFGQPIWSYVGDKVPYRNQLLYILGLGGGIFMLLCGCFQTMALLSLFYCLYAVFYYSIQPVGDAIALDVLAKEHLSYGFVRVAGVAGYASFSIIAANLIGEVPVRVTYIAAALMFGCTIAGFFMPKVATVARAKSEINIFSVMKDRSTRVIFLYGGILILALTFYYNQYSLYFTTFIGGSKKVLGYCYVMSSLSEIPFFFFGDKIIRRFGGAKIMIFSGLMMALRFILISSFPCLPVVIGTQIMHFSCFAVMTVTVIEYINQKVPAAQKVSTQILFTVFILSSCRTIGSLISGVLVDWFGYRNMFRCAAVIAILDVLYFVVYILKSGERYILNDH